MLRKLLSLLCCVPLLVGAAPSSVERFDAKTWAQLQKELPRPAVVVFTATYCANCPALIAHIADVLKGRGVKQHIAAVVIDEASAAELLKSEHYRSATRLFAFDGSEAALRFGVSPRWRGETPYVALLSSSNDVTFVTGTPSDAQIDAWLKR